MAEVWKDIAGYEGRYQVSDMGNVRSLDHCVRIVRHGVETTRAVKGRVLHPGGSKSGHLSVALGKGNSKSVHVLVLRAFRGPPPEGFESLHMNHTPSDNRLSNLVWGPRSENLRMDYEVGTRIPTLSVTGYKGIVVDKRNGRFKVFSTQTSKYIGTYLTINEALLAQTI